MKDRKYKMIIEFHFLYGGKFKKIGGDFLFVFLCGLTVKRCNNHDDRSNINPSDKLEIQKIIRNVKCYDEINGDINEMS